LGFNGIFSTNRLYYAFKQYVIDNEIDTNARKLKMLHVGNTQNKNIAINNSSIGSLLGKPLDIKDITRIVFLATQLWTFNPGFGCLHLSVLNTGR